MEIIRINTYCDSRFSQRVLNQHGCFLIDGTPCEVEIISETEALIRGASRESFAALIREFRFYTPHITVFYDESREVVAQFPPETIVALPLSSIQPTQFYVDEEKLSAVETFLSTEEDIIIQAGKWQDRWLSLDGHTRLYYAVKQGWKTVRAVVTDYDDWAEAFAMEAIRRNIHTPNDLKLVSHETYEVKWNHFCDDFFARSTNP